MPEQPPTRKDHRDSVLVGGGRRLDELEKVPPDRLLGSWVTVDSEIGRIPELLQGGLLGSEECLDPALARSVDRSVTAVEELPAGDFSSSVVRHPFVDDNSLPDLEVKREHDLGVIGLDGGRDGGRYIA